jgi:hypothetical protein
LNDIDFPRDVRMTSYYDFGCSGSVLQMKVSNNN